MAIEKIKILNAILELPPKQPCQSSPFTVKLGQRVLIFSIAMGAKPLFQLKFIACPKKLTNNLFLSGMLVGKYLNPACAYIKLN